MKLKDVEVGGRYTAKISGRLTTIRIEARREVSTSHGLTRTVFDAVNEATGRRITIRSAQRLRQRVEG